jgi:gas vesicle protein
MRRTAMRSSETFVLGAITGGIIGWVWGKEIGDYVGETTRGVRTKAAEGLRAVDEGAGKMLDRGGDALRRADGFLQDTKEHVSEALRAGQETIRPSTPGHA